ncbi:MAG: hypothetical protein K940chlam7_00479 [Chlamydiae bacterium]|nr:hypothetical protein [Chlamydiota bacterium]
MTVLAKYEYPYGVRSDFNRIIEFMRKDNTNPNSLYARVSTLGEDSPRVISSVKAYRISVELETTSEKTDSLRRAFLGVKPNSLKVKTMNKMSVTEQDGICHKIRPNFHSGGGYRIEITNDIGGSGYEKVVQLNLFDPS